MSGQFEVYQDSGGKYRWRLKAENGQIVASSGESFDSKSNARKAAEAVQKTAASADSATTMSATQASLCSPKQAGRFVAV